MTRKKQLYDPTVSNAEGRKLWPNLILASPVLLKEEVKPSTHLLMGLKSLVLWAAHFPGQCTEIFVTLS